MRNSGTDATVRVISYPTLPMLVGTELGLSEWLPIRQERVDLFAEATGDHQWIHVDVERANKELGGTIVHGALIFSLIPLLRESAFRVEGQSRTINYGSNKVRFITPVPVGGSVRLRSQLISAAAEDQGLQAVFRHVVELRGAVKPACVAETISLFFQAKAG